MRVSPYSLQRIFIISYRFIHYSSSKFFISFHADIVIHLSLSLPITFIQPACPLIPDFHQIKTHKTCHALHRIQRFPHFVRHPVIFPHSLLRSRVSVSFLVQYIPSFSDILQPNTSSQYFLYSLHTLCSFASSSGIPCCLAYTLQYCLYWTSASFNLLTLLFWPVWFWKWLPCDNSSVQFLAPFYMAWSFPRI